MKEIKRVPVFLKHSVLERNDNRQDYLEHTKNLYA